jgi:hypothetical protein
MTDWSAVQAEMLELEKLGDRNPNVLSTIAAILGSDAEGLHETLNTEIARVGRLIEGFYIEHAERTPRNAAVIAFMQGVTFARAYQRTHPDGQPDSS